MNERNQLGRVSEWLRIAVANNPEGLLLLAAGGVLLMRKARAEAGRSSHRSASPRAMHSTSGRNTSSGTVGSDVLEQAKTAAGSVAASTSNYAREASRMATERSAYIIDKAQSTFGSSINRVLNDQPLLVAVGGFAAGAAIAAALPPSGIEKQTLGPIGEQLSDQASRLGDHLKETASRAAGTLKTAAQEQILKEGVKKIVSEVTEFVHEGIRGNQERGSTASSSSGDWSGGNKGSHDAQ